jgi:NAD(P)-dependent dehydrogenase (short-subunit alcohol dehydrogenase family)
MMTTIMYRRTAAPRLQEKHMPKLDRKIALVTGASSGIGQATAERLARAGYNVYGTSRRGAEAGQPSFETLPLDVTSDESVEAVVREVMRLDGRIDLLVNNAGFSIAPAGAEESSIEQARSIFDTNFFGTVRMTRAVVPQMRHQGGGRIINIGSVLGFLPAPRERGTCGKGSPSVDAISKTSEGGPRVPVGGGGGADRPQCPHPTHVSQRQAARHPDR